MKLRRDGREADSAGFVRHIDTCLGCMACVTACPSGVQYDSLLEAARPQVERDAKRGIWDRAFRRMIFAMFPHPGRLRALSVPLGLYQKLGIQRLVHSSGVLALLPKRLQAMERLLPPITFGGADLPARIPAQGRSANAWRCCSGAYSACSSDTSTKRRLACWRPKAAK